VWVNLFLRSGRAASHNVNRISFLILDGWMLDAGYWMAGWLDDLIAGSQIVNRISYILTDAGWLDV